MGSHLGVYSVGVCLESYQLYGVSGVLFAKPVIVFNLIYDYDPALCI